MDLRNKIIKLADALLEIDGIQQPTLDDIDKLSDQIVGRINKQDEGIEKSYVRSVIQLNTNIYQQNSMSLHNSDSKNWWNCFKIKLKEDGQELSFWNHYKRYLTLPAAVINEIDRTTDIILNSLYEPSREGEWYRSGLVVGNVQSGKTGNYIGLINKAFDAGYKLVLVLTGMYSDLRRQTQLRIDECVIGKDTEQINRPNIGVGKYSDHKNVICLTSANMDGDFRGNTITLLTGILQNSDPTILVCKKNSSVLDNVLRFFAQNHDRGFDNFPVVRDFPLLVIDDEADSASINTQYSKDEITRINKQIRSILGLFSQSAYVGYTATPYANIFIAPNQPNTRYYEDQHGNKFRIGNDIFPENFIINLTAPSNYIGPNVLFGIDSQKEDFEGEPLPIIEDILDGFSSNKQINVPSNIQDIPQSMIEAIKMFFISTAVRRCRGNKNFHSTMLINVSQYTSWQDNIATIIKDDVLNDLCDGIEFLNESPDLEHELKKLYETKFVPANQKICEKHPDWTSSLNLYDWDTVKKELYAVSERVRHNIYSINSAEKTDAELNKSKLPYKETENGLYAIVVGGNCMSRGLTLEGLSITYFLRSSNTYDTLMQMGRWFGYRDGYIDLCRIYLDPVMKTNFHNIAVATQVMRDDFDEMCVKGISPKEFGTKVMTFPGRLEVTARNKFGDTVRGVLSLNKSTIQAYQIFRDPAKKSNNKKVVSSFLSDLNSKQSYRSISDIAEHNSSKHVYWKATHSQVIDFLLKFKTATNQAPSKLITSYIEKQVADDNLVEWTVVLVNGDGDSVSMDLDGAILNYKRIKRKCTISTDSIYCINNASVIGPSYETFDLTQKEFQLALEKSEEYWNSPNCKIKKKGDKPPTIPYARYSKECRSPKKALLLLCDVQFESLENAFTFAISFPELASPKNITYEYRGQLNAFKGDQDPNDYFIEM